MPQVTVVMATYNWATVLPYSIASVLDQTFTDFELLVIGDGCTDESGIVVNSIEDPRVHWCDLTPRTGHQSGPNNEGIRRAQGEVIAYLGHDDLWLPRHLSVLVKAIDAGASFTFGSALMIVPGQEPSPWPPAGWAYTPGEWIPPTTVAHDRALVEAVGGWRRPQETGAFESESELWMRMAAQSGPPKGSAELTCLKLPAARRRDVYRQRPHDEQEYWLGRLRDGDDLNREYRRPSRRSEGLIRSIRSHIRVRTRLRQLGVLAQLPEPATESGEERWRAASRFKGVDDS
jgi:glycosyltransferase involved in cell wall biosynthesis